MGLPDRRRFINWFLGTSVGALIASVVYPVIRFMSPPRIPEPAVAQVEAGDANDPVLLQKGYEIIRFGADPVIVFRLRENDIRALSATCTHLDCIVEFQKDQSRIYCQCHGGVYDLNGKNVGGPPPRPLIPFKVNIVPKSGGTSTIVVSKI